MREASIAELQVTKYITLIPSSGVSILYLKVQVTDAVTEVWCGIHEVTPISGLV